MARTKKVVFGLEAQDNATPKLKRMGAAADALAAKLRALDGAGTLQGLRSNLVPSVNALRSASSAVGTLSTAAIARAHGISAPVGVGLRSAVASGWASRAMTPAAKPATDWAAVVGKKVADGFVAQMNTPSALGSLQGLRNALLPPAYSRTALSSVGSMAGVARANGLVMPVPDTSYGLRSSAAAGWATKSPWQGASSKEVWSIFAREQMAEAKASFASLSRGIADNKLAIAGWVTAIGLAGKAALDAAVRLDRLDKAYTTITGDSVLAERQLEFVRQKSNELGLEFFTTAEASRNFFAAMKGTSIEKDANDIFEAVSMAATSLSLSEQDVEGTFRALGQMISKGKVQAEELRGQLGERLPGAFQYAAKAMGMTTMELDKALELGNVLADEMLPKLAVVLRDEFAEASMKAASGLQQELNRVNTEWERFKSSVLDSESVAATLKAISDTLGGYNDFTASARKREQLTKKMESQKIQKLGYEEWWDVDSLIPTKKYRIFYTDEQIAEFKALQDAAADAKESIVSSQTKVEKTLSNASRTIKNYLKDTEEARLATLKREYENTLYAIDQAIEARKLENQSYADLVADRARVDAEYARKREAVDKKFKPKDPAKAAEKKLKEEIKDLDVINDVMTEIAEKTGQYGLALESANALIAKQAETWRDAGVADEYIAQLMEIRQLEMSREGWAGATLGAQEYFSSASNMAEGLREVTTSAFAGMEDAMVDFAMTGKLSFTDMVNSMISDLMRLMIRQSITGPLAGALSSGIAGLFGQFSGANSLTTGAYGADLPLARGGVVAGGNLSSYSSSVVTRPTLFSYGSHLKAYASGAGLMGEAGPEGILPLRRNREGRLGVDASGMGGNVQVNIINSTGEKVTSRARSDNHGNKTIDVYVGEMAAKQMVTPGSALNRAVSAQTGQKRPAIRR